MNLELAYCVKKKKKDKTEIRFEYYLSYISKIIISWWRGLEFGTGIVKNSCLSKRQNNSEFGTCLLCEKEKNKKRKKDLKRIIIHQNARN